MMSTPPRMPASERRASMLDAASAVFGERGFAGATTDAIADAAGVSQAYVVRTFGSKSALFGEVAERALDRIVAAFRRTAEEQAAAGAAVTADDLGRAYVELVADRGILLTVMHLLTMGQDPEFGEVAREGFMRVYRALRDDLGLEPSEAMEFLARGMLVNALIGSRLTSRVSEDPDVAELFGVAFDQDADAVLAAVAEQGPLTSLHRRGR